jgi:hypothetical protein
LFVLLRACSLQAILIVLVAWLLLVVPAAATGSRPQPTASLPDSALLDGVAHTWQKWNNCGPATTSMALSAFGIRTSQLEVAAVLKPDPQDVNVGPHEIAGYLVEQGLRAPVRVNGRVERLMRLVAAGVPVIAETWITEKGGMGHYRLIHGYDRAAGVLIAHDSYFGPNIRLPFDEFDRGWAAFNRLYIPVYRADRADQVLQILGADADVRAMWAAALAEAETRVAAAPDDPLAWYTLGDDRLAAGDPAGAVTAYERAIQIGLPWRFFWYQFGSFEAYLALGQYRPVLMLSASTLARMPNIEELHLYRGQAYAGLNQPAQAAQEFRLALQYNAHFSRAARALASPSMVFVPHPNPLPEGEGAAARHGPHALPPNP